jgi:hypothetical protein
MENPVDAMQEDRGEVPEDPHLSIDNGKEDKNIFEADEENKAKKQEEKKKMREEIEAIKQEAQKSVYQQQQELLYGENIFNRGGAQSRPVFRDPRLYKDLNIRQKTQKTQKVSDAILYKSLF